MWTKLVVVGTLALAAVTLAPSAQADLSDCVESSGLPPGGSTTVHWGGCTDRAQGVVGSVHEAAQCAIDEAQGQPCE